MKKRSIKRVFKVINRLLLLLSATTSLLYIVYIMGLSMITYLHNRPIRTSVLCIAIAIIMMLVDEIDTTNRQAQAQRHRHTSTHRQTQAHRQAKEVE